MIVTTCQLKQHLRIQNCDEDAYLRGLIRQAQAAAEDFTKTRFGRTTPMPVKLAVILMASHHYEFRDSSDRRAYLTMRMAFENLLWPYRDPDKLF